MSQPARNEFDSALGDFGTWRFKYFYYFEDQFEEGCSKLNAKVSPDTTHTIREGYQFFMKQKFRMNPGLGPGLPKASQGNINQSIFSCSA